MQIILLSIGKRHDPALAAAIGTYTGRLSHYTAVQWRLLEPAKGRLDRQTQRKQESDTLRRELLPGDAVVLLDERGTQLDSPGFAHLLGRHQQQATQRLVCIIGGAFGVDEALRARADLVWSLSPLVFPHQLVRLILAEQLYRAFTILRGEPYHHA